MKIVVKGGCGFIGSTLVERLVEGGYSVTVLII
jgi:nucleoside-diphosphate-sugar epimerase